MTRIALFPSVAVTCNSQFDIIENAAIHIENNRIVYVGSSSTRPPFEADETIGGDHLVALPGLVNPHTHAAMTLLRGYADDMALETWLQTKIWPLEANLSRADVYNGTLLACAEMLRGGTTTCADMYFFYREGARAFVESGMRAVVGGVLLGILPQPEKRIADAIAFARDCNIEYSKFDGLVSPSLAPHSLYTCTRAQWEKMADAAREIGCLLHTHLQETERELHDVKALWGATPIAALHEIGALESPLLGAHCVHLSERDLEILSSTRCRVAHNPTSNLKLASGFAPLQKFVEREITVGIATDGAASNNDLDMWEEMRLAALLVKGATRDATAVSARQALEMATIGGARCLGLESEIGSLEVGKKADIVLMNFDAPHLTPRHNVVSHLVYAAKASDVDTVLVDGKVLLQNGAFRHLDVARVCREAQNSATRLVQMRA